MARPQQRLDKPSVALRRRPSDFLGRGNVLLQVPGGCCSCTCCCCLHWVGAAVGGTVGIVRPLRADRRDPDAAVHPVARKYVVRATWIGIGVTALLIVLAVPLHFHLRRVVDSEPSLGWLVYVAFLPAFLLVAVAVVPSLAFVPVGAAAMLGAALAKRIESPRTPDAHERERIAAGMGLAWRIAWKSFVWATLWSVAGYMLILLLAIPFLL